MPRNDIVIGTPGGDPLFWPMLGTGAFWAALWSIPAGLLGVVLGLILTWGFQRYEFQGFAYAVCFVPLSSLLLGSLIWSLGWLLAYSMVTEASWPQVSLYIRWVTAGLVLLFQACLWLILVKTGGG